MKVKESEAKHMIAPESSETATLSFDMGTEPMERYIDVGGGELQEVIV